MSVDFAVCSLSKYPKVFEDDTSEMHVNSGDFSEGDSNNKSVIYVLPAQVLEYNIASSIRGGFFEVNLYQ